MKAAAPDSGELRHLGQLVAELALADGGHEARRDDGFVAGAFHQRPEHGRRVDDGIRVGHREDRAVAAGGGRLRARADRLLVLAARRAEMDVRIDEPRSDDRVARVRRLESGDHTVLDGDAQALVDPLGRGDDASFERKRVRAAVADDEHQATSARSRLSTGATVRTS